MTLWQVLTTGSLSDAPGGSVVHVSLLWIAVDSLSRSRRAKAFGGRLVQITYLLEAQVTRDLFVDNTTFTIAAHARATGHCRKRLSRLIRLAPAGASTVSAITEGRQPPRLD